MSFRQTFRIGLPPVRQTGRVRPAPSGSNRRSRVRAGAVRLGLVGTAAAVVVGVAGAEFGGHDAGPAPSRSITAFVGDNCPPAGCGLNHNHVLL